MRPFFGLGIAVRWDIDPEGVRGVVEETATAAGDFEGEYESYATDLETAGTNCQSEIVGLALQDFVEHHQLTMPTIVERVSNSLTGAVDATTAYLQGDREMALEAQRGASEEPEVELPDQDEAGQQR